VNHHDTLFSIAYRAKQKGKKIGIISSVGINHATPAAFYAHQVSRNHYYEIALQATKSDFDVFACGGFIQPKGVNNDFKSAYDIAKENGYQVLNTNESIQNYNRKNEKVMFVSPNTLENNSMPYAIDRKNNSYSLHNFLEKSISILDNENGFFSLCLNREKLIGLHIITMLQLLFTKL
jgi:alkaline phosphatase